MLSVEEAKKVGIWACIEKIGLDFCRKYADNSVSAYGEIEGYKVNCFAGVSDQPEPDLDEIYKDGYFLDSASDCDWPYYATCNVDRKTGEIEFLEFVLPEETTEEK